MDLFFGIPNPDRLHDWSKLKYVATHLDETHHITLIIGTIIAIYVVMSLSNLAYGPSSIGIVSVSMLLFFRVLKSLVPRIRTRNAIVAGIIQFFPVHATL